MTKLQNSQKAEKTKKAKFNSVQCKEKKLLDKIEKAKNDLVRLQNKRKLEIGKMAYKHGLSDFSDATLDQAFEKLAKELHDENKEIKE